MANITINILEKADKNWNNRLLTSCTGNIFQSEQYANYVQLRLKSKPIFLQFLNKKREIVRQLLAFQSIRGRTKLTKFFGDRKIYSKITNFGKIFPTHTFWTFGPIFFDSSLVSDISDSLSELINSWKSTLKGSTHPFENNFELSKNFGFSKSQTSTFIIDLSQNINSIFSNSDKHSVQKNIKRSEKRGVTISEIQSKKDLNLYYNLQNNYRKENKIQPYSKDDVIEYFNLLKPLGCNGFLAWYKDEPIGGISFTSFNGFINEAGIARSQIDSENKLYSQDYLRWKIINWGIQNQCKFYDLSGIKSKNRSSKEEGIFRNKRKWGGTQYDYLTILK